MEQDLAKRILKYRARKRLSGKEFAQLCGITQQTLCRLENGIGVPFKSTVAKILLVIEGDKDETV